ncbi:MAG TPA: transposase [Bacteroidia bacterium]|nr:transposase [Bacteroidia bacterium]MBP7714943.1 transposase [Bacteroidia bacterium]MBP8668241.1 transposase [Bacteroidia bacterium]HOZ81900.1 transposase [Bacteroidia bacterium]HOZ90367.1 transposase [Bacteroidia bacterium]
MSTKYKFQEPDAIYFVTFSVVNWIDVFTRNTYKDILLDSIRHCQKEKGLVVHAWVIMTNHVHMIISKNSLRVLPDIMRDLKKFTAYKNIGAIMESPQESRREWMFKLFKQAGENNSNNTNWQFWQQDNHPIELTDATMQEQRLNYIHENPVRAGFVYKAEDYVYSSACDYGGTKGLLDLLLLE